MITTKQKITQIQPSNPRQKEVEIIQLPGIQIAGQPVQLTPRSGKTMHKSHNKATKIIRTGKRAKKQRIRNTPHMIRKLPIIQLDMPDTGKRLAKSHRNKLRQKPQYRNGRTGIQTGSIPSRLFDQTG